MTTVTTIDEGLHCIDLDFQGRPGVIASYVLQQGGENALVESGPTTTLPALLEGLQQIGVDPHDISKVLITHIHLDHAGASGTFIRRFPNARLYVHEVGAPHMSDPSRLLASAMRIYRDQMDPLWGPFEPVPEDHIEVIGEGDTVTIGDRELEVYYTPGHASHHVTYFDRQRGALFTGDLAAIRMQGFRYVRPATPPPDIDIDLWSESIARMRALQPAMLLATHFGRFDDADRHLVEADEHTREWSAIVGAAMDRGEDVDAIKAQIRAHGDAEVQAESDDPGAIERYELAGPSWMSVDGLLRYHRKRVRA